MFFSLSQRSFCCLFTLLLVGFSSTSACAQPGVWDNAKTPAAKAKTKAARKVSRIKQLRDHIKQWGLVEDYNKGLLVGGRLNSNGWSGGLYYHIKDKPGTYHFWQLHFSEIKHEKQVKQQSIGSIPVQYGDPSSFVFGKINNLYTLQFGFGKEQLLLPGVADGNLSVRFRYGGGISLAMLKPYYLRLLKIDYTQPEPIGDVVEQSYSDSTAALFLERNRIIGFTKWSKGLDETQFVPGLFAEASFVIEPAPSKGFIEAITLGANAAYYTKPLPVMAEVKAYRYSVCLFAGLAIGKRWK